MKPTIIQNNKLAGDDITHFTLCRIVFHELASYNRRESGKNKHQCEKERTINKQLTIA
jgi:hypothetical protein